MIFWNAGNQMKRIKRSRQGKKLRSPSPTPRTVISFLRPTSCAQKRSQRAGEKNKKRDAREAGKKRESVLLDIGAAALCVNSWFSRCHLPEGKRQ